MSLGKSDPPAAPDYIGAAKAQGVENLAAARAAAKLSNPSFSNPLGSRTVQFGGGRGFDENAYNAAMAKWNTPQYGPSQQVFNPYQGGEGGSYVMQQGAPIDRGPAPTRDQFMYSLGDPDSVHVTDSLSPTGQLRFDQENRIIGQLGGMAERGLGRVGDAMAQPFSLSGLPNRVDSVGTQNWIGSYGSGGDIQRSLDFSGAPRLPGVDDFSADRRRVEEALLSRLEPQFQRDDDAARTRLANQGINVGSEAFNRDIDALGRAKNDARMQAILAGGGEQSRLFGLGLQARQQAVGETGAQGAFANAAQAQANAQNLQAAQFGNQANQARLAEALQNAGLANAGRQQGIQEQAFLRQLPLNELNALRSGSQVTMPQFQGYSGTNVAPAPIYGATQMQGQADINQYNAQAQQQAAMMQGLFSLGGATMGLPVAGGGSLGGNALFRLFNG